MSNEHWIIFIVIAVVLVAEVIIKWHRRHILPGYGGPNALGKFMTGLSRMLRPEKVREPTMIYRVLCSHPKTYRAELIRLNDNAVILRINAEIRQRMKSQPDNLLIGLDDPKNFVSTLNDWGLVGNSDCVKIEEPKV